MSSFYRGATIILEYRLALLERTIVFWTGYVQKFWKSGNEFLISGSNGTKWDISFLKGGLGTKSQILNFIFWLCYSLKLSLLVYQFTN